MARPSVNRQVTMDDFDFDEVERKERAQMAEEKPVVTATVQDVEFDEVERKERAQMEEIKPIVTATVQAVLESPSNEEEGIRRRPDRDVRNAIYTIVTGVALPTIPIIIITAILLWMIFHHRVEPWHGYPDLMLNTSTTSHHKSAANLVTLIRRQGFGPAYLVKANPSTITTIASWTSRILPYLASSIMALVAFFVARHIVTESRRGDDAVLPDPEQLTILISLVSGSGVGPLKDTLLFRWLKKERLVSPVPAAFWALMFITLIGLIVPAVDTWFGIATHPVTITMFSNTTTPQLYGRQFWPYQSPEETSAQCAQGPNFNYNTSIPTTDADFWPCTANLGGTPFLSMQNATEVVKLQQGVPTTNTLSTYTHLSKEWIFLTDPRPDNQLDFKASTIAMSTQCHPMTSKCADWATQPLIASTAFNCSRGFRGDFSYPFPEAFSHHDSLNFTDDPSETPLDNSYYLEKSPGLLQSVNAIYFGLDAGLTKMPPLISNDAGLAPQIVPQNPLYFGAWSINPDTNNLPIDSGSDSGYGLYANNFVMVFMNCTASVANVTYTWVNGSINTFEPVLADPDLAALVAGPYSLMTLLDQARATLAPMAAIAWAQDSSAALANAWAYQFSKQAMALASGAFWPLQNELEQHRQANVGLARIPLVPLYLLISLKFTYVIAVIFLAIGAYAFTHPAETEVVKAQLSAKGLAAAHFDQPDLLQKNAVKAVQTRLDVVRSRTNTDPPTSSKEVEPTPGVKRAHTSPADLAGGKPKVGLVPNADGVWKFALMADGVWQGIKPIVKNLVDDAAGSGALGEVGDVIKAWN